MTVRELIVKLQEMPESRMDWPVYVSSREQKGRLVVYVTAELADNRVRLDRE